MRFSKSDMNYAYFKSISNFITYTGSNSST
jgi:hypothetical protein